MNLFWKQLVILAVLGLVASGAFGQIVRVQDGRVLDSNYRIGAGRVNSTTPRNTTFSSQMYITGQVTGLGAFRGVTGYSAENQLRMTVPSASLSGFRRQSVGLADVLSGQTYRTGAYLDGSTTALGLRGITSGLTATGTNVPRTSYSRAIVPRKMMDEAMSDFRPLLGKRIGRAISADIQPNLKIDPATVQRPDRGVLSSPNAPSVLGRSHLGAFGLSMPSQPSAVDIELLELKRLSEDDMTRIDRKVRKPIGSSVSVEPRKGLGGVGIADRRTVESSVFLTMVHMLQQQHLDGAGQNPSGKTDPESGKPNFELKRLGARPDSVELVEQGLKGELIFNTLTGAGKDNFNKVMSAAEKQLKQGNFYNAADRYRVAVEIDPENPTIRLGLAAALFGAGESLGSAIQLRRAMEMFPPVIVTRLKMIRKMPTEALKRKLDEIYKRLEGRTGTNVNPQLAMLATYMHLGAGEDYVAQKCAVKLKGAAGDDKLYQAFATYVISGKRPAALETTTTKPAGDK